jgi:hypothetical protein
VVLAARRSTLNCVPTARGCVAGRDIERPRSIVRHLEQRLARQEPHRSAILAMLNFDGRRGIERDE